MPTPFQHMIYARRLLKAPDLWAPVRRTLASDLGAYLLGATAGDVQTITGRPRYETHFYHFPPPVAPRAGEVLLRAHPALAAPAALPSAQAAFVAGYLTHLILDEVWAWDVYLPCYTHSPVWPDRATRHLHHNALRVWLDRSAEAELRAWPAALPALGAVSPRDWLPFVSDAELLCWRDSLAAQLDDPQQVRTVALFAERMAVSEAALEEQVAAIAAPNGTPLDVATALQSFEQRALDECVEMLNAYWRGAILARPESGFTPYAENQKSIGVLCPSATF